MHWTDVTLNLILRKSDELGEISEKSPTLLTVDSNKREMEA